jgi:acetyltransferase-like isoleucine patch superfamily enzyme
MSERRTVGAQPGAAGPAGTLPSGSGGRWAHAVQRARDLLAITFSRLRVIGYRAIGGRGIHGKCLIGRGARIERPYRLRMGERCVLQRQVWLNIGSDSASLDIGAYSFIGQGTEIEVSREVRIGRGALIAPGVFITDHNHDTRRGRPMFEQPCIAAPVVIGDDVWIGANAVILPGVMIGDGAVVAAGAVVSRNVDAATVVGGVPARVLRYRRQPGSVSGGLEAP